MRMTVGGNVGIGGSWGAYGTVANPSYRLHVQGTAYASGDMRAPIFYDSDNTAYYGDFASTSTLNALNLNTAGTAVFRYLAPGVGTVNINAPFAWNAATGAINIAMTDNDTGGIVIDNEGVTVYGAADTGGIFRVIDEDTWQTNGFNVAAATGFYVIQGAAGGWGRGDWEFFSSARAPIFYDYNNTAFYLDPNTTGTSLNVAGAIIAAGNVTAYSDIRLKEDIEVITNAIDKVKQITGITYTRKENGKRQTGVIAQDVLKVLPEAVEGSNDSMYSVAYGNMVGLLVEAIKEQQIQIEELKTEMKAMKNKSSL